jgi:hypothetical protein
MPQVINYTLGVQIPNGPAVSIAQSAAIEAYDSISVQIPDGAADESVDVQPGGAGQVVFLLVSSDQYGAKLTYKVNNASTANELDAQLLLAGQGAMGLLGAAPNTLKFSNALGVPATIQILVGRKAT